MNAPLADPGTYGYAFAAIVFALVAAYLVRSLRAYEGVPRLPVVFLGAVGASALWAAAQFIDPFVRSTLPAFAAQAFDILRYALWFGFLLGLLGPAFSQPERRLPRMLAVVAAGLVVLGSQALAWRAFRGDYELDSSRAATGFALTLPLFGLMLVEQLFRNVTEDSRWNAKPLCIGLAVTFAFDLYLFSDAALFGHLDPDAAKVRGAVHALATPLLLAAFRRRKDWIGRLQISRSAVFYSATLLLAGGYLLFMSAVGYYVRYFGGGWGRALQLGLLSAGLAFLCLLLLSGSMRSRLRVLVAKNFFSYRFDYRDEWLRFTTLLSTRGSPLEVGGLVVRGLADMVESHAGSLWSRAEGSDSYSETVRWNLVAANENERFDSSFCTFLRTEGWVVDVDEFRRSPRLYGGLTLPNWVLASPDLWLIVPLTAGEELVGFVTLARPRAPLELNWEVRDLLKTASRQAAGILAQMRATEALLEARKFEAFNRMSAFVVHDLKNIVTQLSLMMKNARRLHANPEFQQDMLLTVESSLDKMRRLMLQLREGAAPPGSSHGVELAPMLRRLAALGQAQGRAIGADCPEGLATRGQEERIERVLGHIVQNALDATPPDGQVWLKGSRHSGQVRVVVGDNGIGMSEEFVRDKLFRPFSSTKASGMGIGMYESFQYLREIGGAIAVDSAPGRGTVITVSMPLFDAHAGSDLQASVNS